MDEPVEFLLPVELIPEILTPSLPPNGSPLSICLTLLWGRSDTVMLFVSLCKGCSNSPMTTGISVNSFLAPRQGHVSPPLLLLTPRPFIFSFLQGHRPHVPSSLACRGHLAGCDEGTLWLEAPLVGSRVSSLTSRGSGESPRPWFHALTLFASSFLHEPFLPSAIYQCWQKSSF